MANSSATVHTLRAVELGQEDTYDSTVLHVPDLDLVLGGDAVYGDYHRLFAEDVTLELRSIWLRSLVRVAALSPGWVVPSYIRFGYKYVTNHITKTKEYIRIYKEALTT